MFEESAEDLPDSSDKFLSECAVSEDIFHHLVESEAVHEERAVNAIDLAFLYPCTGERATVDALDD